MGVLLLMTCVANVANAFVIEDTTSAGALTPATDSSFARNQGDFVLFLHETTSLGSYSSVTADMWLPTGSSISAVTFSLGAKTGGLDASWFTSAPTWQSTVTNLSGSFSGVLETSGTWERRTVDINTGSSLGFGIGDSALGISFSGISSAVWATADPNAVDPNFVPDGIGGPGGQQSENFLRGKIESVPEPGTMASLLLGGSLLLRKRRK